MIKKLKHYVAFTKPGISRAQILTVSIGYFLARQSITIDQIFIFLVVGTYFFQLQLVG